jgi:hypothetical protein
MVVDHNSIAQQVYGAVLPARTVEGVLGYLTALLDALPRFEQAGYLLKPAGENIAPLPDGTLVSVGRVCYPDGQLYKVLTDVPNGGPEWADDGTVDPSRYRAFVASAPPADGQRAARQYYRRQGSRRGGLLMLEMKLDALRVQSDANTEKIQQQIDRAIKNAEESGRLIRGVIEPLLPALSGLFARK